MEAPFKDWCRIELEGVETVIFATSSVKMEKRLELWHEKAVCFTASGGEFTAKVYIQGMLCAEKVVNFVCDASNILKDVHTSFAFKGAMNIQDFSQISHSLTIKLAAATAKTAHGVFSAQCLGIVSTEGQICDECKILRKFLLTRKSCVNAAVRPSTGRALAHRLKLLKRKTARLKSNTNSLKEQLNEMMIQNKAIAEGELTEKVAALSPKQREAALHIFKASSRKSTRGMKFSNEWVLECLIMKMKSARLYEHLRKEKILVLPSKSTLRKYLQLYRTGFGFSEKIFEVISKTTSTMDNFSRHGGLIVDEMKLSEHLSVTTAGHVDGFVDLGAFSSSEDKHAVCDHGMVIIFVPFVGKWTQILGAFATRGNVEGSLLAKIMVEAVILVEKAGLRVDFITSDGATWNRKMWTKMGIAASLTGAKCSAVHPIDPDRQLYFISDFPHLIKCLRNGLLKSDFQVPEVKVSMQVVRKALRVDSTRSCVTLQAMHGITNSHTNPNNFERMRVSLAFQLFGKKVSDGLELYKTTIEEHGGDITATVNFFKVIHDLIEILTSRFPVEALRPNSPAVQKLNSFLEFLGSWENHTKGQQGFLSKSTATGLRVTVASVLALLRYLCDDLGFRYLMTSRVSQDPVERLFGIVRQSSGCNSHPTPQQFIITVNCLSFSNLAHSVSRGNCEAGVLSALLPADAGVQASSSGKQQLVDKVLDSGDLSAAEDLLTDSAPDHASCVVASSDSRLIFYIAGYVARKCILKSGCEACLTRLLMTKEAAECLNLASFTRMRDNGGLLYRSSVLYAFVENLEEAFTECFSLLELHSDSVLDVLGHIKQKQKIELGCQDHCEQVAA
ncbi:uncharacterized protein LOC144107018 [Amblyomma americanum]